MGSPHRLRVVLAAHRRSSSYFGIRAPRSHPLWTISPDVAVSAGLIPRLLTLISAGSRRGAQPTDPWSCVACLPGSLDLAVLGWKSTPAPRSVRSDTALSVALQS